MDKHNNTKQLPNIDNILYNSKLLESVFIEICNKNKKNIIVGCIYRHPSMDLNVFNEELLNPLMEKIGSEDKRLFLIGDCNIDLLRVDVDTPTTNFFDVITANLLVHHIIIPTRITPTTRTLIDNIYSKSTNFKEGIIWSKMSVQSQKLLQTTLLGKNYLSNG